jgi:polyhydroxybutyrate depolymerase
LLVGACSSSHHVANPPPTSQANLIAPSSCSRAAPAGTATERVQIGGASRAYLLTTPRPAKGDALLPVVFDFASDRASSMRAKAGARGWVVVTPAAGKGGWSSADVDYISAVLTDVSSRLCIDPARVFAAGMSDGGSFATSLLCAMPGSFAAAGVVANVWTGAPCSIGVHPASLVAFHGGKDLVTPYDGNHSSRPVERAVAEWAGWNNCGSFRTTGLSLDVRRVQFSGCRPGTDVELYTVADAGHEWPSKPIDTTGVMLDFFRTHPRPAE